MASLASLASAFADQLGSATSVADPRVSESFQSFAHRVNPGYQWSRHTAVLGSVMERVTTGELMRVMVWMPPRRSKSESITRLGSAYFLDHHKDLEVGIASYGASIASPLSRSVRQLWLAAQGESFQLEDASKARSNWQTGFGGGCWGTGFGGPCAGRGYSLGIIDDPHKSASEARSPSKQAFYRDWYDGVWTARQAPRARLVIVTNRWITDDLCGWLLQREREGELEERWHIVLLDEVHDTTPVDIPPTCTMEPDWRQPGELLWPERYGDLRKTKSGAGRHFDGVFQQRPSSAVPGALWDDELIGAMRIERIPEGVTLTRAACAVDPAVTHGEDSDETGIHGGSLGSDGVVYVTHDESGRHAPEIWAQRVDYVCDDVDADTIVPESNNGGELIGRNLRAAGIDRPILMLHASESKMDRAEPIKNLCVQGKVKIVGSMPQLCGELTSYTGVGKSPNRLDSFVHLVTYLTPWLRKKKKKQKLTFGR